MDSFTAKTGNLACSGDCTKFGQGAVDELHLIENKGRNVNSKTVDDFLEESKYVFVL
jgi:hypothetical protein